MLTIKKHCWSLLTTAHWVVSLQKAGFLHKVREIRSTHPFMGSELLFWLHPGKLGWERVSNSRLVQSTMTQMSHHLIGPCHFLKLLAAGRGKDEHEDPCEKRSVRAERGAFSREKHSCQQCFRISCVLEVRDGYALVNLISYKSAHCIKWPLSDSILHGSTFQFH